MSFEQAVSDWADGIAGAYCEVCDTPVESNEQLCEECMIMAREVFRDRVHEESD